MAYPPFSWRTTSNNLFGVSFLIKPSKVGIVCDNSVNKVSYRGAPLVRLSIDDHPHGGTRDSRPNLSLVSAKPSENLISKRFVEPGKVTRSADGSFFIVRDEENDQNVSRFCGLVPQFFSTLSNSPIARQPLWRRIFFASKKVRSIILLNILTVIYASNIPVVKEVEDIMDPALFTVVRFAVSAIPFLPFILRAYKDSETRTAGLELGLWISLGYLTQALGLLTSDAGRASFISAFTVIVVPLIDGILGSRIPLLTWFGAIASVAGIGLIESSGSPPTIGDLLSFFSAISFGIHMLRTEHYSRTTKKEMIMALLGYEVWVVAFSSAIWYAVKEMFFNTQQMNLVPWAAIWDGVLAFPWVPALYTGIFSTGLCLWAEMTALRDVSATEAAIIYGLEPLWGAAFAWVMLGERWGALGWFGAILLLGGSLTVQLFGSSPERRNKIEKDNDQLDDLSALDTDSAFTSPKLIANSRKNVTRLKE